MQSNHPLQVEGWAEVKLSDICELISRGKAPQYVSRSIIKVIGQRCVREIGFQSKDARFQDHKRVEGHLFAKAGDVLLNSTGTGTIGRSCLFDANSDYIVDGHVAIIRPYQDACNSSLLNSLLKSPPLQRYLEIYCYTGSTNQIELSASAVGNIKVSLPTVAEQRTIATILDSVDEAIRHAEAVIAKLRQVKAGMLHDLLTYGLDENGELRDPIRHPEQFKDSPLGGIPKGWNFGPLSLFVPSAEYGISTSLGHKGCPVLRMNNLSGGEAELSDLKYSTAPIPDNLWLRSGDVLFNRTNSWEHVGRTGIWRGQIEQATFASYLVRLNTRPDLLSSELLNQWLNWSKIQILMRRFATPAVQQVNINPSNLRKIQAAFPSNLTEQLQIIANINQQDKVLQTEHTELDKLKQLKQGLMHDLLTGTIRVPASLLEAIS